MPRARANRYLYEGSCLPRCLVVLLSACLVACATGTVASRHREPPEIHPFRLAFGSCNDLSQPQVLWDAIVARDPDVWAWLGDIIYGDTEDPERLRGLYEQTWSHLGYARLRRVSTIIGTWDDHDYGRDNAGREYPQRVASQQALLDFLEEPKDSARRKQAGVYAAYEFGGAPRTVRVILLDTRFHRDLPGGRADVLGPEQWTFLTEQLRESKAAVNIVGSSIQVLAEDHPHEKWANFPQARARLLALVQESGARNVIFISGDRHFAELTRIGLDGGGELYDLTSSSLSRPWDRHPQEANPHRVGDLYHRVNFGMVEVDWAARAVVLRILGERGVVHIEKRLQLDDPTRASAGR